MFARSVGVFACLLALAACEVAAQEWTRFRGPKGQGHGSAELPAVLSQDNVRWRVDVGGAGHSSPVLWGGALFLTRVGDRKGEREVVCFDAATGKERWARPFGFEPHDQHKWNSFASATPVVDGDAVYVLWTSGKQLRALALDHAGDAVWQRDLGGFYSNHGSAMPPVLCGDLLVVANEHQREDCFVTALDRRTGKPRWRIDREENARWACYSPPFLHEPVGAPPVLILASYAHGLTGIEPETGKLRWQADLGFKNRFIAVPCLSGNLLLVHTGSGDSGKECAVFDLGEHAKEEPPVRYRPRRGLPYVPSTIAVNGRFYLFADSGFCSCIEAESGKQLWRERTEHRFFSSPVWPGGDAIYIGDRDGNLLSFSTKQFEQLGSLDLGSPIFATPAIANGHLYVRTATELICLN